MTAVEYEKAYRAARATWPKLNAKAMREIHDAYAKAGQAIAAILKTAELQNGEIDQASMRQIEQAILEGSARIGEAMRGQIPATVEAAALAFGAIEAEYLVDAIGDTAGKLTQEGIEKVFTKIAQRTITASLNFAGADGYSFWARVPNISRYFGDDILNLVRAGILAGRDLGDIAQDVNRYIKDGKAGTIHRWGENIPADSAELLRRVPKTVDYRALRLVRSEMGRGLMADALENGQSNPASDGLYDWVRTNSIDWGCSCPSNAANGPYTRANFPSYDHPNCACYCRPHLMNTSEFKAELKSWLNGEPNQRLEDWYQTTYLAA